MADGSVGKHGFVKGEHVRLFTREDAIPGAYMSSSEAVVASVSGDTVEAYLRHDGSRTTFTWSDSFGEYIRVVPSGRILPVGKTMRDGVLRPLHGIEQRTRVNIPE